LLQIAAVERAHSVIVSVGRDDTAVLVVLTVRAISKTVRVIASVGEQENAKLVRASGADVIVSPPRFGGYLMADAVSNEGTVDLLSEMLTFRGDHQIVERAPTNDEVGQRARELDGSPSGGAVGTAARRVESSDLRIEAGTWTPSSTRSRRWRARGQDCRLQAHPPGLQFQGQKTACGSCSSSERLLILLLLYFLPVSGTHVPSCLRHSFSPGHPQRFSSQLLEAACLAACSPPSLPDNWYEAMNVPSRNLAATTCMVHSHARHDGAGPDFVKKHDEPAFEKAAEKAVGGENALRSGCQPRIERADAGQFAADRELMNRLGAFVRDHALEVQGVPIGTYSAMPEPPACRARARDVDCHAAVVPPRARLCGDIWSSS
jgi:hypothetical protein